MAGAAARVGVARARAATLIEWPRVLEIRLPGVPGACRKRARAVTDLTRWRSRELGAYPALAWRWSQSSTGTGPMSTVNDAGAPGRVSIQDPNPPSGPAVAAGVKVTRSELAGIALPALPRGALAQPCPIAYPRSSVMVTQNSLAG
jgi:hypothetical protein